MMINIQNVGLEKQFEAISACQIPTHFGNQYVHNSATPSALKKNMLHFLYRCLDILMNSQYFWEYNMFIEVEIN